MLRIRMFLLKRLLPDYALYIVEEMARDHLQEKIDRLLDEKHQIRENFIGE
jgi:hypothetical protein